MHWRGDAAEHFWRGHLEIWGQPENSRARKPTAWGGRGPCVSTTQHINTHFLPSPPPRLPCLPPLLCKVWLQQFSGCQTTIGISVAPLYTYTNMHAHTTYTYMQKEDSSFPVVLAHLLLLSQKPWQLHRTVMHLVCGP